MYSSVCNNFVDLTVWSVNPVYSRRDYITPQLPIYSEDLGYGRTFVQAVIRPPRRQYPRILFLHLNPPHRSSYDIHPSMLTEDWKPPPPYKGKKGETVRYAQFTFMYWAQQRKLPLVYFTNLNSKIYAFDCVEYNIKFALINHINIMCIIQTKTKWKCYTVGINGSACWLMCPSV